jgi:hypothetical protein
MHGYRSNRRVTACATAATTHRDLRRVSVVVSPTREVTAFAAWVALLLAALAAREQLHVAFLLVLAAYAVPRRIAGAGGPAR